jgi:catechol 2,3-dioxygenase-like lactoylglutathione lyase family enzyme
VLVQNIGDVDRPIDRRVRVVDRQVEVQPRAVALGARRVQTEERWEVLEDPAGLPFCLGFEGTQPRDVAPRTPDRGFLDAVFLDVPADRLAAEVAFWAGLLEATVEPSTDPDYRSLGEVDASGGPLLVEVQRVGVDPERDGVATAPRVHVDLIVDTGGVADEVARLQSLGATHVADLDAWTVLADPAGNRLCIVGDQTRYAT